MELSYNIVKGPSKMALMFALFDSDRRGGKTASFEVEESGTTAQKPKRLVIRINTVSHEDGSGESWCFNGYVVSAWDSTTNLKSKSVEGWFRTTTRTGWVKIHG